MIISAALLLTYIESDGKNFSQHFLLLLLITAPVLVCDMPPLLKCSPRSCVCVCVRFVHRCTTMEISWGEGAKKALSSTFSYVSQHSLWFLVCVCVHIKNVLLRHSYVCYAKTFRIRKKCKKPQQRAKKKIPKPLLCDVTRLVCVTDNFFI